MGPSDLPARPQMGSLNIAFNILEEGSTVLVLLVANHFGDSYIALRVAGGNPGAEVVELSIVLTK